MNLFRSLGGEYTDAQRRKILFENVGPEYSEFVNAWYAGLAMGQNLSFDEA